MEAAAGLRGPRRGRPARAGHSGPRPQDGHAVDQGRPDLRQLTRRLHAGPTGVRQGRPRRAADHDDTARRPAGRGDCQGRRGHCPRHPRGYRRQRRRHGPGRSQGRSVIQGRRQDRRPPAIVASAECAGGRLGGRESRPRATAVGQGPTGHRRGPRPRLPAAAHRAAGADHRRGRRPDQPTGHRRRLRRRPAGLPGRPRQRTARHPSRRASSTPGDPCSSSR